MAGSVPFLPAGGEVRPLQSRVVRTKCKTAAYVPFAPQRLPTYRGYSTISVEKAYQAVIAGEMSLRKAAEEYGVPRSTLHAKVQGKVPISVKSGAKKHLTDEEEERLVEFLAGCASIGYAKSCKEVMAIAQKKLLNVGIPRLKLPRDGEIHSKADTLKLHCVRQSHYHMHELLQEIPKSLRVTSSSWLTPLKPMA